MKKIGFIDYFLDEWHANEYPAFFKNAAGDEMEVCYAYGEIDSPNGMTNKMWAEKNNIQLLDTIEELVEKSDYIVVLSPDNPENHLRLSEAALKSGKPVYIDKTFATKKDDAKKIFELADKYNTPCYSSSALYFSDEIKNVKKAGITRISSMGSGTLENYSVHQIEQIVYLMGYDAKRIMYLGNTPQHSYIIEFEGNRFAQINQFGWEGFGMTVGYKDGETAKLEIKSDFFGNCIKSMTEFFKTGIIPVTHEQTIAVVEIIEALFKASKKPFEWTEIKY